MTRARTEARSLGEPGRAADSPERDPLYVAFLAELKQEFPLFRIVEKSTSPLSHAIAWGLRFVTLGQQRSYLSVYYTVIGDTLYVPPGWSVLRGVDRVILLRHERVHLRQRRRWTTLGMAFIYLIPLLPLGLAYGRARLEWEAYMETLLATAELHGLDAALAPDLRRQIVRRFTGPDYGWMWPFPRVVERWYDSALVEIENRLAPASSAARRSQTPRVG